MELRRHQTNVETRFIVSDETRAKVVNEETRTIRGYGIVFNKESVDLRSHGRVFREVIRPEAVEGVDLSRVLSMHNHRSERLLGNSASGTMRTGVDSVGVWYEVDLPDSPTGEDVLVSVRRGDTPGSSFQFDIKSDGEKWSVRSGKAFREVIAFNGVYEMGPVSEPAYPDTTIAARSVEQMEKALRDGGGEDGPLMDDPTGNTPAANYDLSYMVDAAAWALYRSNDMIYALNNYISNYRYFAENMPAEAGIFQSLISECEAAKSALVSLIDGHADAVKALNGGENRSEEAPKETGIKIHQEEEFFCVIY
jgi:HK97 family phage prohead protease